VAPGGPEAGCTDTCGTVTVKLPVVVSVDPEVVTLIGAVTAPGGTAVTMFSGPMTVHAAATDPNETVHGGVKSVPVRSTSDPTRPDGGENPVTVGTMATIAVALAFPARTVSGPEVAFLGTIATSRPPDASRKLARTPCMATLVTFLSPVPVMVTCWPARARCGDTDLMLRPCAAVA
jgi:hypothetical protein